MYTSKTECVFWNPSYNKLNSYWRSSTEVYSPAETGLLKIMSKQHNGNSAKPSLQTQCLVDKLSLIPGTLRVIGSSKWSFCKRSHHTTAQFLAPQPSLRWLEEHTLVATRRTVSVWSSACDNSLCCLGKREFLCWSWVAETAGFAVPDRMAGIRNEEDFSCSVVLLMIYITFLSSEDARSSRSIKSK